MDHRNFYGRIKGKALNAAQDRYLQEDLPRPFSCRDLPVKKIPSGRLLDMQAARRQAGRFGSKLALAAASIWCTKRWPKSRGPVSWAWNPMSTVWPCLLGKMRKAGVEQHQVAHGRRPRL